MKTKEQLASEELSLANQASVKMAELCKQLNSWTPNQYRYVTLPVNGVHGVIPSAWVEHAPTKIDIHYKLEGTLLSYVITNDPRLIKKPSTVHTRVQEVYRAQLQKRKDIEDKRTSLEWLKDYVSGLHTSDQIIWGQDSGRSMGRGRGSFIEGKQYYEVRTKSKMIIKYYVNVLTNGTFIPTKSININNMAEDVKDTIVDLFQNTLTPDDTSVSDENDIDL